MSDPTAWEPGAPLALVASKTEHQLERMVPGRKSHTMYPVKHMVVTGGLTQGFTFYGLFDNFGQAGQWALNNLKPDTFYRIDNINEVRE